jgi:predicted ArsR family transcriptional regulator
MAESIKEKILAFLHKNRKASALSISAGLRVTKADVQYHCSQLRRQGLVEVAPPGRADRKKKGRPELFYQIPLESRPGNYLLLARLLLTILNQSEKPDGTGDQIKLIASHMAPVITATSDSQRLTAAIKYLNLHNYQARWEARQSGARVYFKNCPYAAILVEHAELCTMDRMMLENVIHNHFDQTSKISLVNSVPTACIFTMRPEPPIDEHTPTSYNEN